MFRFDPFKKNNFTNNQQQGGRREDSSQDPLSNELQAPQSFLQRIASTDSSSLLRPKLNKSSSSSTSSSTSATAVTTSTSFSIPMPTNSWGMSALSCLQDDSDLDDIVDLLLAQDNKATLLLPVSIPSHPSAIVDREFIMDHVIVYKNNQDTNQVISLSGVRGIFQRDQFIALGLLPFEKETYSLMNTDIDGANTKKSLFDTFSLDPSSITPDHPKYNILASHVQLMLRNNKPITVMLIQRPLSKKDVLEWVETKARNAKSTESSLSGSLGPRIEAFIKEYKKHPPKTTDASSRKLFDFLRDLDQTMNDSNSDHRNETVSQRLDIIETYICSQLYDIFFANPEGDEAMQDEALESRIAALNLLDLNLRHLGVLVQQQDDNKQPEYISNVVKEAGTQLQQLNTIMGAKEKLEALVKTHEIIVEAIHKVSATANKSNSEESGTEEVQQEIKQAITSVVVKEDEEEEEKRKMEGLSEISSANADVLLPILIFTIVKSNPTNFLSNLKFISRYRRPEMISGQSSYCLTNMMAAVSFLETTNLVGLGLSADRVYSHVTDLNATKVIEPIASRSSTSSSQQQHATAAGLKLVSDVVDNSYRIFDGIGKFWQRNAQEHLENNKKTVNELMDQVKGRVRKVSDAVAPHQPTLTMRTNNNILSELKEIPTNINSPQENNSDGNSDNKPLLVRSESDSASASSLPSFMENRNNSRLFSLGTGSKNNKNNATGGDGVITKFLEMKSVDELKIGEVTELLADYKRLAAIIKQANLA